MRVTCGIDERMRDGDGRLAGSRTDLVVADRGRAGARCALEPEPATDVRQDSRIDRRGGAEQRAVGVRDRQVEVPGVVAQDLRQQLEALAGIGRPQRRHLRQRQEQAPRAFEGGRLLLRRQPCQPQVVGQCARSRRAALGRLHIHNGADRRQHGEQGDHEEPRPQMGTPLGHSAGPWALVLGLSVILGRGPSAYRVSAESVDRPSSARIFW
jgi:hypothetical protein